MSSNDGRASLDEPLGHRLQVEISRCKAEEMTIPERCQLLGAVPNLLVLGQQDPPTPAPFGDPLLVSNLGRIVRIEIRDQMNGPSMLTKKPCGGLAQAPVEEELRRPV